ncbi:DnaJ domain-containing protein [Candidatus Roizmanbacteria bacterium]|nr:DnaJ domain-containing protein [Candidatus Roizmanbacteria bacterium]
MVDYYEVLGITKNATDQEIKAAYRKQALKWHPDRNKSAEASDKFKEINKAYEVLADSKKRQTYDQYGADVFERGGARGPGSQQGPFTYTYTNYGESPFEGANSGGFSDPFEIFEQFFGFGSPFSSSGRRQREIYQVDLSFEEAVNGVEKEVRFGSKTRKIKIPAGVDNDMRIRFADFDLVVKVAPHDFFKREGHDIYVEKEISYALAVLGGTVDVPTLHGPIRLKIRPGTQSGSTVRLRSEGVPYPNSQRRGDEYIIYKIKVPQRVSSQAKRLLEELSSEI